MGGGIRIVGASPTVRRSVIRQNLALQRGSGVYVEGAAARPHIHNNLVAFNASAGGDPHAVQANGASPVVENNSIVRNDSNGVFVSGGGAAVIVNNLIAFNGSRPRGEESRGRGLCDFNPDTVVRYNLFHRNRVAALLRGGTDYRRVRRAEQQLGDPDLIGNLDGNPRLLGRRIPRDPTLVTLDDFAFGESRRPSPAIGAGDPDPAYANTDGSRNTIGHTGGPFGVELVE